MVKASKPDEVTENESGKGRKTPSVPKLPVLQLPHSITVRQLADLLKVNSTEIIKQLMRNGIMANINQVIDYEAAAMVATGYGYEVRLNPLLHQRESLTADGAKRHQLLPGSENAKSLRFLNTQPAWNFTTLNFRGDNKISQCPISSNQNW